MSLEFNIFYNAPYLREELQIKGIDDIRGGVNEVRIQLTNPREEVAALRDAAQKWLDDEKRADLEREIAKHHRLIEAARVDLDRADKAWRAATRLIDDHLNKINELRGEAAR